MTTIIKNDENKQIEMTLEGHLAYIKFSEDADYLTIHSTQVPSELGGRGIAAELTKFALDYAKEHDLKVVPLCSYTEAYIKKHPEYDSLVD